MAEEVRKLGIYIPSYNRADTIKTHTILEYYKVVVRKSQEEDYAKTVPRENIWAVPDEEIDSMIKVWNYVINNAPEDIICTLGDDMGDCIYRLDTNEKVTDPVVVTSEIERIAQLMCDLKIGFGAVTASIVPYGYDAEFAWKGIPGGIDWFNKQVYKAHYREEIGYCCDTDVVFQELITNRICLFPKYFCSHGGTDTNKGGNSKKSRQSMIDSFIKMKKEWGKYFKYDLKTNKVYNLVKR